jgi:hypothetical protein
MRPALLARVLLMSAAVFGVLRAQPSAAAPVQGDAKQTGSGKSGIVTGEWAADEKGAEYAALNEAQAQVVASLKKQQPTLAWTPDLDFVREHCLKDMRKDEADAEDKAKLEPYPIHGYKAWLEKRKTNDNRIETAHRLHLKWGVNEEARSALLVKDQEYRGKQRHDVAKARQLWLGKMLIGVFVLLGVLACYIRLDEATKGFYTGWLRLGLAGAAAAVGATLWLLF